jgi:hypothetical protein
MNQLVDDLPTIPTNEDAGVLRVLANENESNVFSPANATAAAAKAGMHSGTTARLSL